MSGVKIEYDELSPGSKALFLTSIACYLKKLSEFYDDPLKQQAIPLRKKYNKLPFLGHISEKLLEKAEELKLEDCAFEDNDVLNNDYLKICFGYHEDLYHMLLLKAWSQMSIPRHVEETSSFFQSKLDPLTLLPMAISVFIEEDFILEDLDTTYDTFKKLAVTFLNDYTSSNPLFNQTEEVGRKPADLLLSRWNNFAQSQIMTYDSDAVAERVEHYRKLGNQAFKDKQPTAAINYYTSGLNVNPNSYQLLCNRGAVYSDLNLGELSIADLTKAVKLHPASSSAWARLAFNHLYMGYAVDAIKDYNNAILAAHGYMYPLNLQWKSDVDKQPYTAIFRHSINKRYLAKLAQGLQLARSRAEIQGYPTKYLDDLLDPLVERIYEENMKSAPPKRMTTTTTGTPRVVQVSGGNNDPTVIEETQMFEFPDMLRSGDSNPPNLQQMFSGIQQLVNSATSNANGNGNNPPQSGLAMIGSIMNTFMSGAQTLQGQQRESNQVPATTSNTPTTTTAEPSRASSVVNVANVADLDPDIDIDEVMSDAGAQRANVRRSSGSEVRHDVRDQLHRFLGAFGSRGRRSSGSSRSQTNNESANDAMDHDLD